MPYRFAKHRREEAEQEISANSLGQILLTREMITQDKLNEAITIQKRTGSRLGSILIANGFVRRLDVYHALAQSMNLEFIGISDNEFNDSIFDILQENNVTVADLKAQQWIPVDYDQSGAVVIALTDILSFEAEDTIFSIFGDNVSFKLTTDWDLMNGLRRVYRHTLVDNAANGLWNNSKILSAHTVLWGWQKVALVLGSIAYVACLFFFLEQTLVATLMTISFGYLISIVFKFIVCMRGALREEEEIVTDQDVAALKDEDLPVFTVLVPVYREENIVASLIDNLGRLDYPEDKLEILLLMEEDDHLTREAAMRANCPQTITFLTIPEGGPRTKPKACNIGLFFARGEYVVIYDAEDRPDPDQLKKVVVAFNRAKARGDDSLVCIQAALNYWNAPENALTRMFTLEYSFWFDYMLPGLDALNLPIPLGGTSNHFRTDKLRQLGGWDAYNVTEDADLGIRASAAGMTVGVVNSTTMEEANRAYGNWIRQRSRWIKGYMQTTLVHTRRLSLLKQIGVKQALGFLLLIGGTPLSFLFGPPLYALFLFTLAFPHTAIGELFPKWSLIAGLINLFAGNGLMVYVSMMGAFKRKNDALVPWAILNPVYWMMHSIASYKGLWQLITKPHHWEKTTHGLSNIEDYKEDDLIPVISSAPQQLPIAGNAA